MTGILDYLQATKCACSSQTNALIEDLGLSQVKHTRVKDLTTSERQRLNVACHLLLDADIVVLDQGWDSILL